MHNNYSVLHFHFWDHHKSLTVTKSISLLQTVIQVTCNRCVTLPIVYLKVVALHQLLVSLHMLQYTSYMSYYTLVTCSKTPKSNPAVTVALHYTQVTYNSCLTLHTSYL